jgi:hypothetical protein
MPQLPEEPTENEEGINCRTEDYVDSFDSCEWCVLLSTK